MASLIQQHVAPRVIQVIGFSSEVIRIPRSIIAGCKSSVALTRVYLKEPMSFSYNKLPESNPEVFVDDASMHAYSDTFDGAFDKVELAVVSFGEEVHKMGLTLSPKAVCAASTVKLATALKNELAIYNMSFQTDPDARDVGIAYTAAAKRPNKIVKH